MGNRFQPTSIMRWDRGIFNGSTVSIESMEIGGSNEVGSGDAVVRCPSDGHDMQCVAPKIAFSW